MKCWKLPDNLVRLLNRTTAVRGKCLDKYVFQMSHGSQQVKLYEKAKYRNDNNTPLRVRARTIMRLAREDPLPNLKAKLREFYMTYPYYLSRERKERLKITNFYFERSVLPGSLLKVYKVVGEEPDPEVDTLYDEFPYDKNKKVLLEYTGDEEERLYAYDVDRERRSRVIKVYWGDD